MKRAIVVIGLVLMCSIWMPAQKPKPRSWVQEPRSFLGIQFGVPLDKSVPNCPHYDQSWYDFKRPCAEAVSYFFVIHNIPDFFDVYVELVNGNVESIDASFHDRSAEDVEQALIEKYGLPHIRRSETVQNRMGASFQNHKMTWKGRNIQVDYNSVASNVDEGLVSVYTQTYVNSEDKNQEEHKNKLKGVL